MFDIEDCLTDILAIPGALDALVIEETGGAALAVGRTAPHLDPQESAAALSRALRATLDGLAFASPDGTVRVDDIIITSDKGHHLLRPLETPLTGPVLLYLRLDLERSNLALARHRLRTVSGRLTSA
ncbi:roadblock/LC7 domain-containing protein [Sphaerisporangium fuscum]|uniref:roadblock/LC7 domain-containing protein n=1 Tax=Sphaerisporangium fuscum TaxID=2835868 RepID=UPI001BDC82A3|nr:roadblock/LC7 domain-containing protein [Sphaerisporangium fuscum]